MIKMETFNAQHAIPNVEGVEQRVLLGRSALNVGC